jgi:galactofuranose transport system substrate-binding protein
MNRKTRSSASLLFVLIAFLVFSCTTLTGVNRTATPNAPPTKEATPIPTDTAIPVTPTLQPEAEPTSGGRYTYSDMVVGFIQTGPEGGWRGANTDSFKETARNLGITLKYYDSQNKLENQQAAFRNFINDGEVNVIVLAALSYSGWDDLLRDAKYAGKIVVIEDLRIDAPNNLYATYVGSDFVEEGRKAAEAMCTLLEGSAQKNVVEIAGYESSSAAIDRAQGFREKMGECGITITHTQPGNWNPQDGAAVMRDFLKQGKNIQGVFAQNDDMGIGAISAIKEAGLKPGTDIKIVSVDATQAAFQAMIEGSLNVTVECNPLLGPQVYEAALKALNGEALPKWIPSNEEVFWAKDAAGLIGSRRY